MELPQGIYVHKAEQEQAAVEQLWARGKPFHIPLRSRPWLDVGAGPGPERSLLTSRFPGTR